VVSIVPVPVSAFIITKNEQTRLPGTIAALQPWIDEIIVVDSGSTDETVAIAREMGAKVYHRDWTGYGDQKRFAERLCRNDWLLNIDADEVVTPALSDEISSLFKRMKALKPGAYKLKILNVYPGDKAPRPLANDYNVVRLYHRSVGHFRDHPIYDRVVLKNTRPAQLKNPIYHYPYTSFEHLITKNNRFSSFRSVNSKNYNKRFLAFRLLYEFPVTFIKFFFFRFHFTGGWKGFYFSLCNAFMRTSRVAKMLEQAEACKHYDVPVAHPARQLRPYPDRAS
jgi:glycosyltransferase involved in cell wall biosynthesis